MKKADRITYSNLYVSKNIISGEKILMLVFLGNTEDNFTTFYGNFFSQWNLFHQTKIEKIFSLYTMVKNHFVLLLIFEEKFKSHDNTMNEN